MWCLNNISNFHIEPKSIEDRFKEGYYKWERKRIEYLANQDYLEEDVYNRWNFS